MLFCVLVFVCVGCWYCFCIWWCIDLLLICVIYGYGFFLVVVDVIVKWLLFGGCKWIEFFLIWICGGFWGDFVFEIFIILIVFMFIDFIILYSFYFCWVLVVCFVWLYYFLFVFVCICLYLGLVLIIVWGVVLCLRWVYCVWERGDGLFFGLVLSIEFLCDLRLWVRKWLVMMLVMLLIRGMFDVWVVMLYCCCRIGL